MHDFHKKDRLLHPSDRRRALQAGADQRGEERNKCMKIVHGVDSPSHDKRSISGDGAASTMPNISCPYSSVQEGTWTESHSFRYAGQLFERKRSQGKQHYVALATAASQSASHASPGREDLAVSDCLCRWGVVRLAAR